MKKKRKPPIKPLYIKDSRGRTTGIILTYKVYQSILDEIDEFEAELKADRAKKRKKKK